MRGGAEVSGASRSAASRWGGAIDGTYVSSCCGEIRPETKENDGPMRCRAKDAIAVFLRGGVVKLSELVEAAHY